MGKPQGETKPRVSYAVKGGFTAEQDPATGKWTILDVPIFAEHKVPGTEFYIGEKWLKAAVQKAQARFNENGWLNNLHIGHHGFGEKPVAAGKFMPTRVGRMVFEGKPRFVLFADLTRIPDEIFQKIKDEELTGRSVEIARVGDRELSSLALLSTETPFFRLPPLTIKNEIAASQQTYKVKNQAPVLAYSVRENSLTNVLMKMEGANMPDTTKDRAAMYQENGSEEEKDEKEEEDKPEMAQEPEAEVVPAEEAEDRGDQLGALASALEDVKGMLAKILEALGGDIQEGEDEAPAPAEVEASAPSKFSEAKVMGRLAATEAKIKGFEKKEKEEEAVKATLKSLASYNLGDTVETELYSIVRKEGIAALKTYAEAVKKYGAKCPGREMEDGAGEGSESEMPELKKYAQKGPDVYAKAREYARNYDLVKHNSKVNLERYIDLQFTLEGGN